MKGRTKPVLSVLGVMITRHVLIRYLHFALCTLHSPHDPPNSHPNKQYHYHPANRGKARWKRHGDVAWSPESWRGQSSS